MSTLNITGKVSASVGGKVKSFTPNSTKSNVTEALDMEVQVSHSEPPSTIFELVPDARGAGNAMNNYKFFGVQNTGKVPAEIMIEATQYYDNSNVDEAPASSGAFKREAFISLVVFPGDQMVLPTPRVVIYNDDATGSPESAANAVAVANISAVTKSIDSGANDGPTDGNGEASSTDHFGETDTAGVVPGSYVINFYASGYQELGITNTTNKGASVSQTTESNLAANTAYTFKITVDGGSAQNIAFTTHTSDTTLGDPSDSSSTGVLRKIQVALNANSVTNGVVVSIVNGDIRFTSPTRLTSSAIALAAPDSGTTPFGVGIIPAVGDIDGAVAAALEATSTADNTLLSTKIKGNNTDHLMLDQGDGTMTRVNGGTATIDYDEGGTVKLIGCPPNANFQVHYIYNSAHSGELLVTAGTSNALKKIFARSMNRAENAQLQIVAFN